MSGAVLVTNGGLGVVAGLSCTRAGSNAFRLDATLSADVSGVDMTDVG